MNQHHVIPAFGQFMVKDDRPSLAGMRLGQPCGAETPTAAQTGQVKAKLGQGWVPRYVCLAGLSRAQGGLPGQFQSNLHHRPDILRRQPQLLLGLPKLAQMLLNLLAQVAFKLEQAADRAGLVLGGGCVQKTTLA